MEAIMNLSLIGIFLVPIIMLIGLFSPKSVLSKNTKHTSGQVLRVYGIVLFALVITFTVTAVNYDRIPDTSPVAKSSTTTAPSSRAKKPVAEKKPQYKLSDYQPASQKKFRTIIKDFSNQYQSAEGDLNKSRLVSLRREKLREKLGTPDFTGWVGVVDMISTTSKGNAFISLKIGDNITIMTHNNELSDIGDNTLIPNTSPIYDVLANVRNGDLVKVSGRVLDEISITEAGGMTAPDWIIKISNAEIVTGPPEVMSVGN